MCFNKAINKCRGFVKVLKNLDGFGTEPQGFKRRKMNQGREVKQSGGLLYFGKPYEGVPR